MSADEMDVVKVLLRFIDCEWSSRNILFRKGEKVNNKVTYLVADLQPPGRGAPARRSVPCLPPCG